MQSHIANFLEQDFSASAFTKAHEIGRQIRGLLHKRKHDGHFASPSSMMGINPKQNMHREEEEIQINKIMALWGQDPIHPSKAAYRSMAGALLELYRPGGKRSAKRKLTSEDDSGSVCSKMSRNSNC